jgi:hypothetical protein
MKTGSDQIKAGAYARAMRGKKAHNFAPAQPGHFAELASETFKSRYRLDPSGSLNISLKPDSPPNSKAGSPRPDPSYDAVVAGDRGAGASGEFQERQCAAAPLDARTGQYAQGQTLAQMNNILYYGLLSLGKLWEAGYKYWKTTGN